MPFAVNDGVRIYWKGEGDPAKPPLLLLNSIGTDMELWRGALPRLLTQFHLVRIDTRGHGASDAPRGDYSLDMLAADALAVLDAAEISKASVAGVSLGGMVAMALALKAPERVSALALICTSPKMDEKAWGDRVATVRAQGTEAIADGALARFLSPRFARYHPDVAASLRTGLLKADDEGYAGCAAAIRDMSLIEGLGEIKVPTLIVAGDRDVSTPFAGHGDRLAAAIPGAEVAHLDVAHLAPIEAPDALADTLLRFFTPRADAEAAAEALFALGLLNRRRVLGDEWVDASLANRTPFNSDFQAMITRIAWHEIWGRPGLDDRLRRLLVIAITSSLGRWEEFALHVRSGLSQEGFTQGDLKEVLMQVAIYAGVPAANTGFSEAGKIIAQLGREPPRGG